MHPQFPNLYTPIQIGSLTLRNRVIASPSSQNDIEPNGTLGKHNIAYYARKAQGGAALVTVGDGIVHPTGKDHPVQVLLYNDDCLPSLTRCAEEIHKYGAFASYELSHGGIVCDPKFINGERPYGPSEVPVTIGFQTNNPVHIMSQEMTEEMMIEIADAYAQAALRCKKAGFDMVMVHGAHGWLFSQFFSPYYNKRTDKYGGSVENRCRFAIMTLKRIREVCGPRFPIDFRINGRDGEPEGALELEESVQIAKLLEPYVDSFHVSASLHGIPAHQDYMQSPIFTPHGHLLHLAAAMKEAGIKKPICTVGGFNSVQMMEDAIAEGKADMVAMGRQFLADPDIANKGKMGRAEEVRPCQRCATCQSGRFTVGTARCAVNPEIGREYELQFVPPAQVRRKVIIAGGGPGGMQAAITAAKRGHDVTLYEKSDVLGGALNFAQYVPFKNDLYKLIGAMEAELKRLPVRIMMNTELTPELAEMEHPDVIISAMGAEDIRPPFPGIDNPKVMMSREAESSDNLGQNIVIIGGGLVGVETALNLAMQGKKVSIVEMLPSIANDANFRYARTYKWKIEEYKIDVYTSTKCKAITEEGVEAEDKDGNDILIPADNVILSVGMRPLSAASEALRDCAPIFIPIGNCVRPGVVKDAIRAGFDAAMFQI